MTRSAHDMFERRLHALTAGLVLLGIALVLTIIVAGDVEASALQPADDRWLAWMIELRTPAATDAALVMAFLGGPLVMVPLRLLVAGLLAWRRRWLQLVAFGGAIITSELCIGPLKALIDRPRPPAALVESHSPAFPSGHAIASSVTAIGLVIVLVPVTNRRTGWTVFAASFAALMAMSRTYLGAHWASDVIAGACIGTGLAIAWPAALELERSRRRNAAGRRHSTRRADAIRWTRTAAIGLVGLGVASVVALHVLRADLGPAGDRISEYAIGRFGPVMTLAFVGLGLGLFALAAAVALSGERWSPGVAITLAAAGVGMIASAIWRTDPTDLLDDRIHSRASGFATLALLGAAIAWSLRRWPLRLDLAAGLAAAAVVAAAVSPALHRTAWTGVSQRVLWLALTAWAIVAAVRVRPTTDVDVSDPSAPELTMYP